MILFLENKVCLHNYIINSWYMQCIMECVVYYGMCSVLLMKLACRMASSPRMKQTQREREVCVCVASSGKHLAGYYPHKDSIG